MDGAGGGRGVVVEWWWSGEGKRKIQAETYAIF